MTEVLNLQSLRSIPGNSGNTIFVKGHTNAGDGGGGVFIWQTGTNFIGTGIHSQDNNGTIIKVTNNDFGRWVRQFEGFINVLFFGAFGIGNDYTYNVQEAINFASINSTTLSTIKGATVFIPNGSYIITNIILKSGISIIGESISDTLIYSPGGASGDYLFEMEIGPVFLNVSNLKLIGNETEKGCFHFKAMGALNSPQHGGLWYSVFKNMQISNFKGDGIYIEGGEEFSDYLQPNQFNVFENIRVTKSTDFSSALRITGHNGQLSFINCTFDGFYQNATYSKGQNINISNKDKYSSAVISFINCTTQNADYGFYIAFAGNITIDNCWFENLGVAITVKSNTTNKINTVMSKSVNILNSRFSNASGFGSLYAPNNIKAGQCISVNQSFLNVYNNYVTVSDPEGVYFNNNSSFLMALNNSTGGVNIANNTFRALKLGKTYGIMQVISVINNTIDCSGNKLVFVTGTTSIIKTILSSINAGEKITIRANGNSITFDNSNNIFLTLKATLTINNGEIVTFVKIDNTVGSNYETYQLISIVRANT